MYIPNRATLASILPDSVEHSEDRWRHRTAEMYLSACLVAREAGPGLRGSGLHGRHAALVAVHVPKGSFCKEAFFTLEPWIVFLILWENLNLAI